MINHCTSPPPTKMLLAVANEKGVFGWNVKKGSLGGEMELFKGGSRFAVFSPDGRPIAFCRAPAFFARRFDHPRAKHPCSRPPTLKETHAGVS